MTDRLQDLLLPKAAFIFKRMCDDETVFYECRDCKAFDLGDLLLIQHKPYNIYVIVPFTLINSYMEGLKNV